MITTILQTIILLFGITMCAVCVLSIYSPNRLVKVVKTVGGGNWGIFVAIIVRLLLGMVLILLAPDTRFPVIFMVLGALFILSAIIIQFVGRKRINLLMTWIERLPPLSIRLWLLLGIAFGSLLIYGIS